MGVGVACDGCGNDVMGGGRVMLTSRTASAVRFFSGIVLTNADG